MSMKQRVRKGLEDESSYLAWNGWMVAQSKMKPEVAERNQRWAEARIARRPVTILRIDRINEEWS